MNTQIWPESAECIAEAAHLLRAAQVVAIPTETVYGLAADATSSAAVQCIFAAKGRPQDNPLIVHIADTSALYTIAKQVPPQALALAEAFWPGPLTLVLPRANTLAAEVSAGLPTVGVRLPAHAAARAIIQAAGVPLAAPSANLSGSPSPTSARHVLEDLNGRIPLIIDGGASPVGVESTVLSLTGPPTVLRPGFVTAEEIAAVLGEPVALAPSHDKPLAPGQAPASPGMKYRHYAPKAEMTILTTDDATRFVAEVERRLPSHGGQAVYALCFAGEEGQMPVPCVAYGQKGNGASQAAALFDALRRLDEVGAAVVYARSPATDGVGLAVRNRLLRAAAFRECVL